jgi:hypothetical protein
MATKSELIMKTRYLRTILLFLGIAGIIAYFLYPKDKEAECLEKDSLDFYPYGDSANGMVFLEIEPCAFKCELSRENGNCGFGFFFDDYENWNLMDFLVLEIETSENFKELIVQILTFDPSHTKREDRSTMKPMLKELKLNPNKKRYSIAMGDFYTPDYWFEQQGVKNYYNPKRFSYVSGIEMFAGWKNEPYKDLKLKTESICLEGVSNVPFVILVIYIGILIATAISVRTKT